MLATLLFILSVAQAGEGWRELPPPGGEGSVAWRPASDEADEVGARRVEMWWVAPNRTQAEMTLEVVCAARTRTLFRVRAFDAAGQQLEAVTFPQDQRPKLVVDNDATVWAALYAEVCPDAAMR